MGIDPTRSPPHPGTSHACPRRLIDQPPDQEAVRFAALPVLLVMTLASLTAPGAAADPAPFGLAIGRATQGEIGTRYSLHHLGQGRLCGGDVFDLAPRLVAFPEAERIRLVFGQDRILLAVLAELPRAHYSEIKDRLTARYHLEQDAATTSCAWLTRLIDGDAEITLHAPARSANLRLAYIHRRLLDAADRETRDRRAEAGPL